ncbi:MAG TPA: alpha/beta fold hydrolase [Candidatus Mcinerneyibacteriales bacterium]|nr:alpha/beta fold hydrolase [Candidatus Mcinerneyibacteriales bacterium]
MGHLIPSLKNKKERGIKPPLLLRITRSFLGGTLLLFLLFYTVWLLFSFLSPPLMPWHEAPVIRQVAPAEGLSLEEYLQTEREYVRLTRESIYGSQEDPVLRSFASEENIIRNSPFYREPREEVKGSVLLLHGLTDSPYTMSALGDFFARRGYRVLALRLEGHGTVPGALLHVRFDEWKQQVLQGVMLLESQERGRKSPLYLAGFSTGAALSLSYTLDVLEGADLTKPEALFLFSPAFAVSPAAALTGLHAPVSHFPLFRKFAWLDILAEEDPCKYSSFPKNAAWQIYRLSRENEKRVARYTKNNDFTIPVYTFQSAADATVSAQAVIRFYEKYRFPGALTLFDIHPAHRGQFKKALNIRDLSREWKANAPLTVVTGEYGLPAEGNVSVETRPWAENLFSLSHVALLFSPDNALYSRYGEDNSITWGEKRLFTGEEEMERLRVNPFFEEMTEIVSRYLP